MLMTYAATVFVSEWCSPAPSGVCYLLLQLLSHPSNPLAVVHYGDGYHAWELSKQNHETILMVGLPIANDMPPS